MKLKQSVKNVLVMIGLVLAMVGCFKLLALQEQGVYNDAVERCGSANNLVEHHTQQGDTYYSCKVDK